MEIFFFEIKCGKYLIELLTDPSLDEILKEGRPQDASTITNGSRNSKDLSAHKGATMKTMTIIDYVHK